MDHSLSVADNRIERVGRTVPNTGAIASRFDEIREQLREAVADVQALVDERTVGAVGLPALAATLGDLGVALVVAGLIFVIAAGLARAYTAQLRRAEQAARREYTRPPRALPYDPGREYHAFRSRQDRFEDRYPRRAA